GRWRLGGTRSGRGDPQRGPARGPGGQRDGGQRSGGGWAGQPAEGQLRPAQGLTAGCRSERLRWQMVIDCCQLRFFGSFRLAFLWLARPLAETKKPSQWLGFFLKSGAQEKTRTSTVLPPLGPEPSASTNSATWAHCDDRSPTFAAFTAFGGTEAAPLNAKPSCRSVSEEWCPGEDSNFHGVATART